MAITLINSADNLAAKLWSKLLLRESLKKTYFRKFMGTGQNAIIQILDDLQKRAGDKITFGLRMLLTGAGRSGNQTLKGNFEKLSFYDDAVMVDLLRHGVSVDTTISQQRTEYVLRTEAKDALSDWWANIMDTYMFRVLSGDTTFTFGNTGTAPDAAHNIWASTATSDATLTTAMKFELSLLDKAVVKAKMLSPMIRPVNLEGDEYWCCVLHPYQVKDMRANTTTNQWFDIQKSALMGGKVKDNPIFTGALGIYNGVILYESSRIYTSAVWGSGANVPGARALFLGAQAGVVAFGSKNGVDRMTWYEEEEDAGKELEVSAGAIFGIKKTVFSSADYGVIAIDTAADA